MITDMEELKRDLEEGRENSTKKFVERVCKAVDNKEWVYMPCKGDNQLTELLIADNHGLKYIEMFFNGKNALSTSKFVCTDINKAIDVLYNNKYLTGLVFDVNNGPVYINRETISALSNRKDPRLQKREWGKGIPKYREEDIMTDDEIFDMGFNIALDMIEKKGYEIVNSINNLSSVCNVFTIKDGKRYIFRIETALAPNMPKLEKDIKDILIRACKENDAKPMYMALGFGSSDSDRFDNELALIGDGFYCNFEGIQEVK